MNRTTKVTVSTFGALSAAAGIEHGIGEILQGNKAPDGIVILSWPDSAFFHNLGGEPAMTVIPNLLVTGILATIVSLLFILWAARFMHRKDGGLVLILLSVVMLLVGGGFGPPILGIIIGAAGTRIHSPLNWWRIHLPAETRRFLAWLWPWTFGAGLMSWLSMVPGIGLLDYFLGVYNPNLIYGLLLCMFGFLFLTIIAAFARDIQTQNNTGPGSIARNYPPAPQAASSSSRLEPR